MDNTTAEFVAIQAALSALEAPENDPKNAKQLRKLATRIEAVGRKDGGPDIRPLRQEWCKKYIIALPMPDWAPNKWLPLDHDNVSILSERHKMPHDRMSVAKLGHSLSTALTVWSQQHSADRNPTAEQVKLQILDAMAAAETLSRKVDELPEHVQTDLDERLRDYLPETAVSSFIQILKDRLPQAAEPFLEGKRWSERVGYVQQTGRGRKGTGEAFRQLVEALVRVWANHAPNKKTNRALATKATDGTLQFNAGGRFVHDAAALLTRGEAPELTPAVLRNVVNPAPHKMTEKMVNLVRSRELK